MNIGLFYGGTIGEMVGFLNRRIRGMPTGVAELRSDRREKTKQTEIGGKSASTKRKGLGFSFKSEIRKHSK